MSEETTWLDGIEDEALRINPAIVTFKTADDIAKGFIDLKAYQGRSIGIPGDEANDDAWKAFDAKLADKIPGLIRTDSPELWSTLGVPEDLAGYKPPEDFTGLSDDMLTQLQEISHKAGLTPTQYHNILGQYAEATTALSETETERKADELTELKKEWGAAYDDNMTITNTIKDKFEHPTIRLSELNNAGRLLILEMTKSLTNDPQIFNQINNPSPQKTPAELTQDIDDMRTKLRDKKITGQARKVLLKRFGNMHEELAEYS